MKPFYTTVAAVLMFGCAAASESQETTTTSESHTAIKDESGATLTTDSFEDAKSAIDITTVTLAAQVKKLDVKERMITLKAPQGNEVTFKVGEGVKRLNEVKVGDSVVVDFVQSLAFEVREATDAEKKSPQAVVIAGRAPQELPPGAAAARSLKGVVTVVGLDKAAGTVTVKHSNGIVETVKAREPQRLDKVKVGDTVAFSYTEAVAVSVEPIKGKKAS